MPLMNTNLSSSEKKSMNAYHESNGIYIAEVMDTRSPLKNGDIKVWILNSGTSKENPINWVTAHSSNNVGSSLFENVMKSSDFNFQSTSYGVWNTVPFVGNYVFVFYPHTTDISTTAYWFGSPNLAAHTMIPGISYNLETSDYQAICDKSNMTYNLENPSAYPPLQKGLKLQGLDNDRLRGISTASTTRDTPSHCYGFLSPLGNQFVIDDGWSLGDSNINWINNPRVNNVDNAEKDDYGAYYSKKEWIASLESNDKNNKLNRFHGGFRFRTRNGTQLLILDAGNIYMINKDGTAWAELSEDGYIDCYSEKGISAASDGDINLHALNINIEALNKISMKARAGVSIETDGNVMVKSGSVNISDRVSVPAILADSGQIGVFKSPLAEITGTFSGTLQGTAYYATAAGFTPLEQKYPDITPMTSDIVKVTDPILVEQKVNSGYLSAITTRVPTHEPWAGHDKNDNIPPLIVKQMLKKEEKEQVNNTVSTNMVRR